MQVLDHFDFDRCREHLDRNPQGSILLTMKDDRELSITDLYDRNPVSTSIRAERFPIGEVAFDPNAVTFAMLLPRDPRLNWREGIAEVSISTRQRRRKPATPGGEHEHGRAAA